MRRNNLLMLTSLAVVAILAASPAIAEEGGGVVISRIPFQPSDVIATAIYGLLGIALSLLGYYLIDLVTPFSLGKELVEEHNIAVAIVVAALILGVCLVVSSAVR